MPRIKRQIVDNGIYHILNRGYNREGLFNKASDFTVFKEIIRKYKEKFSFELYNYCLMANHFHLLLSVSMAKDLSAIMKGICQSYANYYKRSYKHTGYLYQNRYKSIHIDRDAYLLECARYIERNPLRAKVVKDLSSYLWSSYNYYSKGIFDNIITANPLYETLGGTSKERRSSYIEYISEPRPYEQLLDEKIATLK